MQLLVWWPSRLQSEKDQASGVTSRLHSQVINAQGRGLSQQDCLPQELPRNLPVTLLLHPDDISLLPVQVPDVRGKKAVEALAYATEPLVLADVDDLFISAHGALQNRGEGDWRTVACVERMRTRGILAAAADMGLDVRRVSCEPLFFELRGRDVWLIATTDGAWVCSAVTPPWLLRNEELTGGAVRLKRWLQEQQINPGNPVLLITSTPSVRSALEDSTGLQFEILGRDALAPLANPVHLLPERDMRVGGASRTTGPSRWRLPLQLAGATLLLAIVLLNVAAQRVRNADQAIAQAVEDAFARAMPNTPMVADPLIMLERARQQLTQSSQGGSSDFTRLLHAGASQMQSLPFNSASLIQYDGTTLNISFGSDIPEAQRREIDNSLRSQQLRGNWQTDERKRNRISLTWNKN